MALVVDEAQSLSDELLEEVRLLTNVETAEGKLLTLVLIGQPKLAFRLNEDMWKQLKQRIEIRSSSRLSSCRKPRPTSGAGFVRQAATPAGSSPATRSGSFTIAHAALPGRSASSARTR